MNTKQKLAYIAIGGLLVAAGMIISPLNAQKDKFGEIECTKLTVVDADGKARVMLSTDRRYGIIDEDVKVRIIGNENGGWVITGSKDGEWAALSADVIGTRVAAYGDDGKSAELSIGEYGGEIEAWGKAKQRSVLLGITVSGAVVHAFGKDGMAWLNPDGNGGFVGALGKDQKSSAVLGVGEYGGYVQVGGKGEGAVALGVNEYGNGAVSTYDKNGRRR